MPDLFSQLYPLPKPNLKHLFLSAEAQRIDYKGSGGGGKKLRDVERKSHSELLNRQLSEVAGQAEAYQSAISEMTIPEQEGMVLRIESEPGYPLTPSEIDALTTKTGETADGSITLLSASKLQDNDGQPYTRAILNVPFGCICYLEEKIRIYSEGSGTSGQSFLSNISSIIEAAIDFLWTDDPDNLPRGQDSVWWQLWVLKSPESALDRFNGLVDSLGIELRGVAQELPERYVFLAKANYQTLAESPALLDTLGEIRGAHALRLDFMDIKTADQREYVEEALKLIEFPAENAPSVCLLDTGVNRAHRLLEGLLDEADNLTVYGDGFASDAYIHIDHHGHGTPMAGLAAFGDLRILLDSTTKWEQHHRLESVRILDPARPHDPDNYGAIIEQAIALTEENRNNSKRVYCLAVTAPGLDDGRPSAWSAAVDGAAFGVDAPDAPKRLIVVSAGNVNPLRIENYTYPDDNRYSRIEDPAQAWNAVTVGALTHRIKVTEPDDESKRLFRIAAKGALSPFSRTSFDWNEHWPIKPEIVLEGGNAAEHADHGIEVRPSLELVSTSAMTSIGRELCCCNATSAATAQASRMLSEILHQYPDVWPETARGLLIHSARWNDAMLGGIDPHARNKTQVRKRFIESLRQYGYGEPDIGRCNYSAQHAVTMIREDSLQPYIRRNSSNQLNDCHIHTIPVPKELLSEHSQSTLTLRVTLSYFTAPNPSANNAIGGSRYRYGGSLLRFVVRHKDDSVDDFNARLEKAAADEDKDEEAANVSSMKSDPGWALGRQLRGKGGSLIHDVWRGSAADLLTMDRIAVFPRKGWWANRKFDEGDRWHKSYEMPQRYSLLISIDSEQDIPLYEHIQNIIEPPVTVDAT